MFVGAVYARALFLKSTKYARSQTAPTADSTLLGQALKLGVHNVEKGQSRDGL